MATIYIALDVEGEPLYVGQTARELGRLEQHHSASPWWRNAASIELIHLPGDVGASDIEALLIRELQPPFNRAQGKISDRAMAVLERVLAARGKSTSPDDQQDGRLDARMLFEI